MATGQPRAFSKLSLQLAHGMQPQSQQGLPSVWTILAGYLSVNPRGEKLGRQGIVPNFVLPPSHPSLLPASHLSLKADGRRLAMGKRRSHTHILECPSCCAGESDCGSPYSSLPVLQHGWLTAPWGSPRSPIPFPGQLKACAWGCEGWGKLRSLGGLSAKERRGSTWDLHSEAFLFSPYIEAMPRKRRSCKSN